MSDNGAWLSINDYAQVRNISISTVRRHIKGNIIKFKNEGGKYFIWHQGKSYRKQIEELTLKNKKLLEEIENLKMLINIYENKSNQKQRRLPSLPV